MFKVNLEEKLIAEKRPMLSTHQEAVLREARKILDGPNTRMDTLEKMGLMHAVKESENIRSVQDYLDKFDQKRVFRLSEIKSLCLKYGLRFLDVKQYKGNVDSSVPEKVEEFRDKYQEVLKNRGWNGFKYEEFKVCAPEKSFKLEMNPNDPLLFYPLGAEVSSLDDDSKTEPVFYLVHKWGNDLSVGRYFRHLFWRNKFTTILTLMTAPVVTTFLSVKYMFWSGGTFAHVMLDIGGVILIAAAAFMTLGVVAFASDKDTKMGNAEQWNNVFKM